MPKRKTIEIDVIKKEINRRLAIETLTVKERQALSSILEFALFKTGNYKGFNYIDLDKDQSMVYYY